MDYFTTVEAQLSEALRRRAHRGWRKRARLGGRGNQRLVLALALCAVTAGTALAATGVIPLGSPVRVPAKLNPRVGSGVPAPGGSTLLPISVPDPEGGSPWGIRVVRTTRGLLCVQVARMQEGKLGVLGIDGSFRDDGRFHPLPASAFPDAGGARGVENAAPNTSCQLPSEPFLADKLGVARGGGGPLDTTHMPRGSLRDLHYGVLGPEAVSVSYSVGGHTETQQVVKGLGAYLIVTPTTPQDQIATGGGSYGSFGGIGPVPPLTEITYVIHGHLCERVLPGPGHEHSAAHPCPPPQSLYGPRARAGRPLHLPLHVKLDITSHRVVLLALVGFRAPLAVTGAGQSYEVRAPIGPCHGNIGGYTAQQTDRDIPAGEAVSVRLQDPFGGTCGKRSTEIRLFYNSAGYPPREVGSTFVREPAGTRPVPVPKRR